MSFKDRLREFGIEKEGEGEASHEYDTFNIYEDYIILNYKKNITKISILVNSTFTKLEEADVYIIMDKVSKTTYSCDIRTHEQLFGSELKDLSDNNTEEKTGKNSVWKIRSCYQVNVRFDMENTTSEAAYDFINRGMQEPRPKYYNKMTPVIEEELTARKIKKLGIVFSPTSISTKVVDIFLNYIANYSSVDNSIYVPCAGTGELISAIQKKGFLGKIYGCEYDSSIVKQACNSNITQDNYMNIVKSCLSECNVLAFFPSNKFSTYKEKLINSTEVVFSDNMPVSDIMLMRTIIFMETDRIGGFIMPRQFLTSKVSKNARAVLIELSNILNITELNDEHVFIVVVRKKKNTSISYEWLRETRSSNFFVTENSIIGGEYNEEECAKSLIEKVYINNDENPIDNDMYVGPDEKDSIINLFGLEEHLFISKNANITTIQAPYLVISKKNKEKLDLRSNCTSETDTNGPFFISLIKEPNNTPHAVLQDYIYIKPLSNAEKLYALLTNKKSIEYMTSATEACELNKGIIYSIPLLSSQQC
jgi:hypothetical protein